MCKNLFKTSVLITSMVIVYSSCSKDDDPVVTNLTNGKTTAVFSSDLTYGAMTDQDGNVYKTITIGTQTWMAENLRTTKYNDGTSITNVTSASEWGDLTTGAYCNYNNTTSNDTIATYGRLYNWSTVNTGKLAPKGWHVPTDAEWTTLTTYLGREPGSKLKETGITHWFRPNTGATNESGFTSLPGGIRFSYGAFRSFGSYGYWWSTTELQPTRPYCRVMGYADSSIGRWDDNSEMGYSVRCVRD
jgi:uncharacterized protein (TIGR02145 family)